MVLLNQKSFFLTEFAKMKKGTKNGSIIDQHLSSVVQFVSLMLGLRNSHFSHECIFLIARKNLVKKWLSYYGWKTTSRAIIRFSVVEEGDFLNI